MDSPGDTYTEPATAIVVICDDTVRRIGEVIAADPVAWSADIEHWRLLASIPP